jgi:hypothetical protein
MKILVCRFVKGVAVALWFRCEKGFVVGQSPFAISFR